MNDELCNPTLWLRGMERLVFFLFDFQFFYTINFQGKKKSHHAEERQPYQQPIHLHVSSTNKVTLLRP